MTLRASMLVPLIYGPPNLRRVTYIVSPRWGFLFTRAACATSTGAYRGATSTSVSHVTEYLPSLKVRLAVNYWASKPEPMLSPYNRCSIRASYDRLRSCKERRVLEYLSIDTLQCKVMRLLEYYRYHHCNGMYYQTYWAYYVFQHKRVQQCILLYFYCCYRHITKSNPTLQFTYIQKF